MGKDQDSQSYQEFTNEQDEPPDGIKTPNPFETTHNILQNNEKDLENTLNNNNNNNNNSNNNECEKTLTQNTTLYGSVAVNPHEDTSAQSKCGSFHMKLFDMK